MFFEKKQDLGVPQAMQGSGYTLQGLSRIYFGSPLRLRAFRYYLSRERHFVPVELHLWVWGTLIFLPVGLGLIADFARRLAPTLFYTILYFYEFFGYIK
jgi:hypothetical protein